MNKKIFNKKLILLCTVVGIIFSCFSTMSIAYAKSDSEIFYGSENGTEYTSKEIEYIDYSYKEVVSYKLNSLFPNYYNTNHTLSNCCASVAGANIIGYYDRYYDELLPNCVAGIERANGYMYYPMTLNKTEKQELINSLYISMSTNVQQDGVSQENYNKGLLSYVKSKGKSYSYTSVMKNGIFDIEYADTQLRAGKPIALFLSGYNFIKISDNGTRVELNKSIYSGNHIIIMYGYEKVNYYNSNNDLVSTKIYLNVTTGNDSKTSIYILNNNGNINDAEAANIY